MAAGKVCTGFSLPYVAKYSNTGNAVTYSNGMKLARGVNVSIDPESSEDNGFFADNVLAENADATFTSATLTLTVDGLLKAAEEMIMGVAAPGTDGWIEYGDDQTVPYVGVGFIARYMSDGVTTFTPYVLAKCMFNQVPTNAETQEETINWQTQELTARVMRGDDAKHNWKYVGDDFETEAAAEAALKTKLGIQS
jgi:phi13 family phage major tail protein